MIGLVQVATVVAGFGGLGFVMKQRGYPDAEKLGFLVWNPLAIFLRENGVSFLFVSLAWVFCAAVVKRKSRGVYLYRVALTVGLLIAAGLLWAFLFAIVHPIARFPVTELRQ